VKLLTLSKEEYEEVKDRFPDARDILISNVRGLVGLGKDGEYRDRSNVEARKRTVPSNR